MKIGNLYFLEFILFWFVFSRALLYHVNNLIKNFLIILNNNKITTIKK